MTLSHSFLTATAVAIVLSAPARAEDWAMQVTSYLWFPETRSGFETPRGEVQTKLSASDALKNLDAGLMVTGIARSDDWSIVGDVFYLDVDGSARTPFGVLFSKVASESKLTSASAYALYRVSSAGNYRLDLGLGLRAMHSDMTLRLLPGALAGEKLRVNDSWADPLLALRYDQSLNDNWTTSFALDYGGFGWGSASDETWQAVMTVGYRLNEKWSLNGGWRHLHIDRANDGVPYKLKMSGPLLGAAFRF